MNRNNDALRLLQSSKSLDPNRVDTLYYLGIVYMSEKDWGAAQTEFRIALSLTPDNADIHDKLGIVFAREDTWEKAREAFQSALKLNPSHLSARINLKQLENKIRLNRQ